METSEIQKKWLEVPEKRRINAISKAMNPEGGSIPHAEAKRRVFEKFKHVGIKINS